ncbi:uncharacterized protein CIMG_00473 [Coccidioides immitis RS]|uniref:Uncharacterized protein n=3 Tax=Coccidioides immitis TaxID=5501 RepID=J3KH26_COCIM|nr:uncharacterized protein CIMG_00473 [Coccidioides immitis RS]EAS35119.3 hypothetical protein CIMG_00473 [Coccidioides immitis RS]KMU76850.1 hypothetical protein CISG_05683 [Coccidioides immitis RMSCC 3703]KMU84528.1 hypothetical protein CIHG_02312 [Coccidioides immitis H538.4]TPX26600.1 hypothetical protein DIZ76_012062 [Coccidioides immitis]
MTGANYFFSPAATAFWDRAMVNDGRLYYVNTHWQEVMVLHFPQTQYTGSHAFTSNIRNSPFASPWLNAPTPPAVTSGALTDTAPLNPPTHLEPIAIPDPEIQAEFHAEDQAEAEERAKAELEAIARADAERKAQADAEDEAERREAASFLQRSARPATEDFHLQAALLASYRKPSPPFVEPTPSRSLIACALEYLALRILDLVGTERPDTSNNSGADNEPPKCFTCRKKKAVCQHPRVNNGARLCEECFVFSRFDRTSHLKRRALFSKDFLK